ncbi:alpha/beta fold hydrolase [Fluviispira multicolorata]|uniref:Alpha/beta fold hydrolase n=1 Tax=Fluviispira multicolorata TaxID=2654512 RepID=A0A833N658_9BACT|nr:alpha/beta fold hydrolase [Fluviispira multicolorata]KAB8029703.1 alpha/beta fold hydrolase [Fluviispira multicolorata]
MVLNSIQDISVFPRVHALKDIKNHIYYNKNNETIFENKLFKRGCGTISLSQIFSQSDLFLEYEISGNLNAPIVIVQGGISSTKHIITTAKNQIKGWWDNIVGYDKCIDLNQYCLISCDYLSFNNVSTHDQAAALSFLLQHLEIKNLHAFIGYSYGGMVALAFAELNPNKVDHIIALGAAHESVPQSYALRLIQQKIVELNKGTDKEKEALATARQLGIITYRSSEEINSRFNCHEKSVVSYLKKKGDDFVSTFSSERFLNLSKSINGHKVTPSKICSKKISLICCKSDQITPLSQINQFAKEIISPTVVYEFDSIYGHDSYLNETEKLTNILNKIV